MSTTAPKFPDYGDNGDMAGARRMRRAFRLCVASFVLLTGIMWLSEEFLRYEDSERLYLRALTLPDDSARVMLLQAIRTDARVRAEHPTPKYQEALAVRSEDDVILNEYARAMKLDPTNSLFAIRYGCALFRLNRPKEAALQFDLADSLPQKNALPMYLKAASLARAGKDTDVLREAMVIVARTNGSRNKNVFPRPLWSSAYPQDGYWYASLSHAIVDETCGPLYYFMEQVAAAVEQQIVRNQTQDAKTWLQHIRLMGESIAFNSEPKGVFQAIAGLTIQMRAVELLDKLAARRGETLDENLIELRANIKHAQKTLNDFVNDREEQIQAESAEVYVPLKLGGLAAALFFSTHFLAIITYRLTRYRKSSWTLPHSTLGLSVLGGGCMLLFLLLQALALTHQIPNAQQEFTRSIEVIWTVCIVALALFGLAYPAFTLKPIKDVSRKMGRPEEMDETMRFARRAYRKAYASLALRYYGILSGLYASMFCAWGLSYRIFTGLYPWEERLITTGLIDVERETVVRALSLFG